MDPVTLIVSSLITGAASKAQEAASDVVQDAYSGLKALLQRLFRGTPAFGYRPRRRLAEIS
jgi:hypothetical protein